MQQRLVSVSQRTRTAAYQPAPGDFPYPSACSAGWRISSRSLCICMTRDGGRRRGRGVCVCVCMHVCARAREGKKEREREARVRTWAETKSQQCRAVSWVASELQGLSDGCCQCCQETSDVSHRGRRAEIDGRFADVTSNMGEHFPPSLSPMQHATRPTAQRVGPKWSVSSSPSPQGRNEGNERVGPRPSRRNEAERAMLFARRTGFFSLGSGGSRRRKQALGGVP